MTSNTETMAQHVERLQRRGVIDMHFDMLMDLYEKRDRSGVLGSDYWPELSTGRMTVLGVAIYIEDRYLPEMGLRVALGQIARLYTEVAADPRFAICKSHADIEAAQKVGQIALLITMEGVEPLGTDLDMLRVFYELGVRSLGLTHVRRNMAGEGGVFAPRGSSPQGLTAFGRTLVHECERLGIILDLAHLNPAGVDDVLALTNKPVIISHSNPRRYYDMERHSSDENIRAVGKRGGVMGVNAVLVSANQAEATLDRYVDHIEYVLELAGIDGVGIGFDFFDFIHRNLSEKQKAELASKLTTPNVLPDLSTHAHAPNLTLRLVERGFRDADIEKILSGNWMRVFKELL
jgi:membrane dipeptidase